LKPAILLETENIGKLPKRPSTKGGVLKAESSGEALELTSFWPQSGQERNCIAA
jgi:hypothetical protein